MGRRERRRARRGSARQGPATGPRWRPDLGTRGSRRRSWVAAFGFGLLAVVLAVAALASGDAPWLRSAILMAVLSVLWAARAAFTRD
jgi:hypothetical protein